MMNFEIFYMLQDVLRETLNLDLQYVADPTGDLRIIDHGLREQLFGMEGYQYLHEVLASEVRVGKVLHIQDRLHMNYFLFPAHKKKAPYCSVGPFFSTTISEETWKQTFEIYAFTEEQQKITRDFLIKVPVVSVSQAFSVAQNVLLAGQGAIDISVRVINMTPAVQPLTTTVPVANYRERRISPEEIYRQECVLAQSVAYGNYEESLKTAQFLLNALAPDDLSDLSEYIGLFHWANAQYRRSAQDYGIPPYLVQELYHKMYLTGRSCSSYAEYVSLQIHMLTAYCNLCKEYSTKDYSPVIRQVVNHIRMNLSQELDIQAIAKDVGFSQTYITHKFKDEVGMPPSKFILEQRIRLAKKMLATSNRPINEIAADVGVIDVSYFSRMFKKSTGKSPSDFRKLYEKE